MLNRATLTTFFSVLSTLLVLVRRGMVFLARLRSAYRALRAQRQQRRSRNAGERQVSDRRSLRRRRAAVRRALRPVQANVEA